MLNQKKTATDLIQEASKLINLALDNYTSANSYLALIKYNEASENYNKAIHSLKQVLKIEPNNLCALQDIGDAFISIGKTLHWKSVVTCDKKDNNTEITDYNNATGYYEQSIANYNEAIHYLEQVLKIEPSNLRALQNIGDAFISIGKTLHWKSVVTCDKKDNNTEITDYNNATGYYEQSIANYNEAIACFDTLLQHAPDNLCALQSKGGAFIGIGDALRNKKCIENALAKENITDEDVLIPYKYAIEECYNEVLELDPENVVVLGDKTFALLKKGDSVDALKCHMKELACSKPQPLTNSGDTFTKNDSQISTAQQLTFFTSSPPLPHKEHDKPPGNQTCHLPKNTMG